MPTQLMESVLIANRGEIACRIIRTCRRLGIRTIAVFSEADADALHVRLADERHLIGPAEAARSYLRPEAIIEAALAHRAAAIHPGYGFLSEKIELAELCAANGVIWVGPSVAAIRSTLALLCVQQTIHCPVFCRAAFKPCRFRRLGAHPRERMDGVERKITEYEEYGATVFCTSCWTTG